MIYVGKIQIKFSNNEFLQMSYGWTDIDQGSTSLSISNLLLEKGDNVTIAQIHTGIDVLLLPADKSLVSNLINVISKSRGC